MADNVAITAGTGTTVAADDIGGVMHQRVKLSLGADGSATDAVGGSGVLSSAVQRVTVATDDVVSSNLVTLGGAVSSARVAVNCISGQAGVAAGAGAVGATVQRMTLASDDPLVARVQSPVSSTVSITRTADTNAYTAGDVIGTGVSAGNAVLSFTSLATSGSLVNILGASLEIDKAAIISGETSYRLHLHSATPNSNLADNAAFDLTSGDRTTYLGYINLGTPEDLGSTVFIAADGVNKVVRMTGTGLFGYLQTVGAYTPASATVYVVKIHVQGL